MSGHTHLNGAGEEVEFSIEDCPHGCEPAHSSGCVCRDCNEPDEDAPRVQEALDNERPKSTTTHSSPPWDQTLEAVVTWDGDVIASVTGSDFSGDRDDANMRRIVAAVNATAEITTAGLEEIARRGLTLELALLASLCVENSKAGERDDAFRLRQLLEVAGIGTAQNTNDEQSDDERYPLSRAD